MPGRNGVASSIHYPLPQPATVPFSQADKQQWTWNFIGPLALQLKRRIAIFYRFHVEPVVGFGFRVGGQRNL